MKKAYYTFEKEYLLLHEILSTLRKIGLTITATGSEEKGHIPLYEFQLPTARLHFGTLVGLLNNPEKYKPEPGQINYLINVQTTKEQVSETKYTWDEVAIAVETLVANEEVTKEIKGDGFLELEGKIIQLSKKGLASLNTKKYLKQYEKERNEKVIYDSTLSNNFWMKCFTGVLAFSAVSTFIIELSKCTHNTHSPQKAQCKPPSQKQKKDSIYIYFDTLKVGYSKESEKTLKLVPKTK